MWFVFLFYNKTCNDINCTIRYVVLFIYWIKKGISRPHRGGPKMGTTPHEGGSKIEIRGFEFRISISYILWDFNNH